MVDNLKNLLENPIGDGLDKVREQFDSLFGELPREDRKTSMLLLSVPYVLKENAAIHFEMAAKYGKIPGPGSLEMIAEATARQFEAAIKATIQAAIRMNQEARKNKGK